MGKGHERPVAVDDLPADKRACSSLDSRPSSSNSSVQTPETLANSIRDHDMGSSSSSESSRSDSDYSDDAYGSCDSNEAARRRSRNALREQQLNRSGGDHSKFNRVLTTLNVETDESTQLVALTELCELLSFSEDSSFSSSMVDSVTPILVRLSRHVSNPDIMLLSTRAITYLCDTHPHASAFLVKCDGVSALCQRLTAIDYMDVAEQCLQALEKISREQPVVCFNAGAIMAVLTYIDFFSTSLQRVALSTVVNICEKLPSDCHSHFMEAVPILCNLLQYEDRQLVEKVATCLIKVAEQVYRSPAVLDELSGHGLIHQVTHLIDLKSRTTLSLPVHAGLVGLLVKLASGSMIAVRTLFELNITSSVKDILLTNDLSNGTPPPVVNGHCNMVIEVLKLLNELLPAIERDEKDQLCLNKEAFLMNEPHLLQKFGLDVLPVLIQVFDSGVDMYTCYGCLSIINKLINFSKPDLLFELLKNTNISSFLAGVFTRKDHHVLMLALQIVDKILEKLTDFFLGPFIKEGVFFALDVLNSETPSQFVSSMFNNTQLSNDSNDNSSAGYSRRCLCYSFDTGQTPSNSNLGNCRLEKVSAQNLARSIRAKYFATDSSNSDYGLTDILRKLRTLSTALTGTLQEEEFCRLSHQIMSHLDGKDSISTFEFIESGVVRSLVSYLSNGQFVGGKAENVDAANHSDAIEKRIEVFGRLLLSSSESQVGNFHPSALVSKLQTALSLVENFPVVLYHSSTLKNSYTTIPNRRSIEHPCLKVKFVRAEGEASLKDYSEATAAVDPFSSFDSIEGFLWPKVGMTEIKQAPPLREKGSRSISPSDPMQSDEVFPNGLQEEKPNSSPSAPGESVNIGQTNGESTSSSSSEDLADQEIHTSSQEEDNSSMSIDHSEASSSVDASLKLNFFLQGEQLDRDLTLYQAIIQQQSNLGLDRITSATLWSQVHTISYRRSLQCDSDVRISDHVAHCTSASEESRSYGRLNPLISPMFVSELPSSVGKNSPCFTILLLLKILEGMNRFSFHLMSRERIYAFAEGRIDNLEQLKVITSSVQQNEFVSSRLTEKLEQQMRDPMAVSISGMPSWCMHLMASCPFLFSFEARCKYFRFVAFAKPRVQRQSSSNSRSQDVVSLPRKKFLVYRNQILESASKMMERHARQKVVLEVEYDGEVGTGLGPTLEFYTLVSQEFQKPDLGMWRGDNMSVTSKDGLVSNFVLFPRPWSSAVSLSNGVEFSEVIKKYVLLGQVMAKAIQDRRVLDLPFSKAFYKLIIGQELTLYDIQSFDPALATTLLEFQALIQRRKHLESMKETLKLQVEPAFRNTRIEDLCLDFTLPGYSDYLLNPAAGLEMVNTMNLEEYVRLVVDATINSGISRQVDAFKSGFNQVFPIDHLRIFTEEELERLLCGEHEIWNSNELLDHIKFDHGYTASSAPVVNLLEIIKEFNRDQQKAFLQFVTGAPRLPPGGLASLNPKLTIVRKHCGKSVDVDLPSVMTCANYLKLPPYSSKDTMKEKLLYAMSEGQGSFHLS